MKPVHLVFATCALALLVACGGDGNPAAAVAVRPTPTTTLPPATLAELSATSTSPQADGRITCRQAVKTEVRLTNNARSSVVLIGIEHSSRVVSGGCEAAPTYTFTPFIASVGPGQTSTVFNDTLYGVDSGCCPKGSSCSGGSCVLEESMKVLTRVGDVPAGKFRYQLTFKDCTACSDLTASGRSACPVEAPDR
jgi:hypothetical protein